MPAPLLAVFGLAVVAGVGFTIGKRLTKKVIEPNWNDRVRPWIDEQAESFNRWSRDSTSTRPRQRRSASNPDTHRTAGTEGAAPTTASPNDGSEAPVPAPSPS